MRHTMAILILLMTTARAGADDDRAWLIKTFDDAATTRIAEAATRPADNTAGGIAWGLSYSMESLAEMLAATGDAKYAEQFVRIADLVCEAVDSRHGRRDVYRDAVVPAWGSTKYSQGKWHVWAVHTGMTAEPLARFAGAVRQDDALRAKFGSKADEYLAVAQKAVAVHNADFREGPGADEGYLFGHVNNIHAPLNMQNALARAWIRIDDATGRPEHRERIAKLARFFKNRIRKTEDGGYVWAYRPPLEGPGDGFEDTSHAAINVDFLVLCREHGIVFTDDDVRGIEKTLLTKVIRPDGTFAANVGGTGKPDESTTRVLRWGSIARHSTAARERLMQIRQAGRAGQEGPDMLGCALLVATCTRVPSSQPAVELLGQPCRAKQILGACVVTDRADGRERLVLLNNNETYGCELLYIDFEKDCGEVFSAPAGSGSWTVIEVPGDRLVVGTFYDGAMMVFDLKAKQFTKAAKFAGEGYVWNLALGKDGRVYGGTYPGGKLGALDLETYRIEDCGAPAKPNQYLRMVSHAPWGEVFCNFGMETPTTKIYNTATRAWRDIPGLGEKSTFGVGATWNGYFVAQSPFTGHVEAFRDASLKPVEPRPFPTPKDGEAAVDMALTDAQNLYLQLGNTIYHYAAGSPPSDLKKIAAIELRGGRYVAKTKSGELLGVRGQDYFRVKPGDTDLRLKPVPVESRGRPSLFLEADAHGRIWGGPHFGQTLFYYDTATGKAVNTGVICDDGGEVYDVTFHGGATYAASYAGGDITRFDPAKPWDQWNHKNPSPCAKINDRGYIRPEAGILTGPDGKLYAGWVAKYGTYGGAISITDPKTGQTDLIENPLGTQAICSFDVDANRVYVGTQLSANGLPHQKGPAKVGVIDLASRKVTFETPINAAGVGRVTREPKSGLVVFTVESKLFLFDPTSNAVTPDPIAGLPKVTATRFLVLGDGTLLTGSGPKAVRIDPAAKKWSVVFEAPAEIRNLTMASDGRLYFNHKADLYRTVRTAKVLLAN